MTERIFNIFMYQDADGFIRQIGCVMHERGGSDGDKIAFLQSRVDADCKTAPRFMVPESCMTVDEYGTPQLGLLRWSVFDQLRQLSMQYEVLEPMFQALDAPRQPLSVITAIVDGKPRIDGVATFSPQPV